jgi:flagellar motor switch protein FliN/FliY
MSDEDKGKSEQELADEWAAAMEDQGVSVEEDAGEAAVAEAADTQKASFDELKDEGHAVRGGEDVNLDVILDIPVSVSMEIGRTRMPIRNLLQLNQGSVVELDRLAGEPMDVLVNGTLIAHGEVVVVNEKFGVRLTDIISQAERVKRLK